jgi:hypothetical protein
VVTVAAATAVSAAFVPQTFTLSVTTTGAGRGTVTSVPGGIACPLMCAATYATGAQITLTAQADPGSIFTGWAGGDCPGTGLCVVTLGADTTVTATFARQSFALAVTVNGPGSVQSSPAGILCGAACAAAFEHGTVVTLAARSNAGARFSGWSGACTGTAALCTVTVTEAQAVNATFVVGSTTAFTDDPLVAGATIVKAIHVVELRQAIERERSRRSLPPFTGTDPVLVVGVTPVGVAHLIELRQALDQAYRAGLLSPPTYTDPGPAARQVVVRAAHIAELRAAVRALE